MSSTFLTRFLFSPISDSCLIDAAVSFRFGAGVEEFGLGYVHSRLLCAQALHTDDVPVLTPEEVVSQEIQTMV